MKPSEILVIIVRNGNKIEKEIAFYDGETNELKEKIQSLKEEYPFYGIQVIKPYLIEEE
ncbi:MAG: hypothetical protein Q8910_00230 [Bacteroidota bacterium]|nr:hypothetical protein [Bacteroidota bacterium]